MGFGFGGVCGLNFNPQTQTQKAEEFAQNLKCARADGISISLMKTGNMLVKGAKDKKEALQLYDEVMKYLVQVSSAH